VGEGQDDEEKYNEADEEDVRPPHGGVCGDGGAIIGGVVGVGAIWPWEGAQESCISASTAAPLVPATPP
jgi:hypothetical protein